MKDVGDEHEQLVEGMKSRRLGGCKVLHPALESPGFDVGFRTKLNDESRFVLPSFHYEGTIVQHALKVIILA